MGIPPRHWLTAEPRACLEVNRRPDKNIFLCFGKKEKVVGGLDLESTVSVTSRLPSPISDIALQFQMNVLEHYHAVDKHVEILSLESFLIIFLEQLFSTTSR